MVGVTGVRLTVTLVGAEAALLQPEAVALERAGFCRDEVKPFGPVQEYVAPATVGVESWIVAPSQYGPPLEAVGVAGVAFTTTDVVPAAEVQPLTVIVTE